MKTISIALCLTSHAAAFSSFTRSNGFFKPLPPLKTSSPCVTRPSCVNLSANSASYLDSLSEIRSAEDQTVTVFDFTGSISVEDKAKSLASFDRIDDAIMGGISLSALKDVSGEQYASWSGVCRTDGGGFCGIRTLPLKEALSTADQDGIFVDCRLASDNEPERRVWKLTMRTASKRTSEIVYQAAFEVTKKGEEWSRVKVPFDSFKLVRGPRTIPDAPKADTSKGVYQIGLSLSKFAMGGNTTELLNFRPGYFDLQIQRIGFYNVSPNRVEGRNVGTIIPDTQSKDEADKSRPMMFKILSPVLGFLFSEQSRRRRSAMKILMNKRGMSRRKAILYGISSRKRGIGLIPSLSKTLSIIGIDSIRTIVKNTLKIAFLYPIRLLFLIKKFLGKGKRKPATA